MYNLITFPDTKRTRNNSNFNGKTWYCVQGFKIAEFCKINWLKESQKLECSLWINLCSVDVHSVVAYIYCDTEFSASEVCSKLKPSHHIYCMF